MEIIIKILALIVLFFIAFKCSSHILKFLKLYKKTGKSVCKRECQATGFILFVILIISWTICSTF